jgi:hypothetical protein
MCMLNSPSMVFSATNVSYFYHGSNFADIYMETNAHIYGSAMRLHVQVG